MYNCMINIYKYIILFDRKIYIFYMINLLNISYLLYKYSLYYIEQTSIHLLL